MKQFVLKSIFFICGIILFVYCIIFVLDKYKFDYLTPRQRLVEQTQQLLQNAPTIELLVLGNSHSASINFDIFEQKGYYLWTGGEDIFEVKHRIWVLLPYLRKVDTIFLPISYFSFHADHKSQPDLDNRPILLHTVLPGFHWDDGAAMVIQGKLDAILPISRIMNYNLWIGLIKKILKGNIFVYPTTKNLQTNGNWFNKEYLACTFMPFDKLKEHARVVRVPLSAKAKSETLLRNPNVQTDVYRTLSEIIAYLKEHNIRLILFTPPYFSTYTELYDATTIVSMNKAVDKLKNTYHIEYYNFSTDQEFIYDERLFRNSDHLNQCGAQKFSTKFKVILDNKTRITNNQ